MSDDVHVGPGLLAGTPGASLAVAQAVLRAGDGSLPPLLGVGRRSPAFLLPADRVPSPPWVHKQRRDLAIVAATTGAAAIGLYAGAWAVHAQFDRRSADDVPGLERDRLNAFQATLGKLRGKT